MRTIIEYVQLCHIHFYQKIARKKVARVNAALLPLPGQNHLQNLIPKCKILNVLWA